ncbi:MAG: cupin domain-containing protein [Chloroflexi bacterium]|nr:cupin domain-containing protein [Chloroflexota bacterium]
MSSTKTNPTCRVIPGASTFRGKQGLDYFAGVSTESAGATGICMHSVTIPPGTRANAHLHENHETAIYILSGEAEMWFGEDLAEYLTMKTGDYVYIPAGVPHLPSNPSPDVPCVGIIARTDPNEQESVVLRPDLEAAVLRPELE